MLRSSPKKQAKAPAPVATAYKDKHEQMLRIAASDVAAVAGYHEWVDVRDLFLERLLYQDLEHLLRIDAANIGIELEDRRQRSERLLAKAGDGELRALQKKAGDGAAVATVQDAQALRDKARSLLKDAEGKKRLSKQEAKELENDLRHDINTQFGTRNENVALDVYERRSGTEVICSNERILVWPFPGSKISGDEVPERALDPPIELSKGWTKAESRRGSERDSTEAEAAFAAATASCLAKLAARAAIERGGNEKEASSEPGRGDANGVNRRPELEEKDVSTIATIERVAESNDAGGGGGGSEEVVVGADPRGGGSGVAADVVEGAVKRAGEKQEFPPPQPLQPPSTAPVPEDSATTSSGGKQELVPGVPWPEWRGSVQRGRNTEGVSTITPPDIPHPGGVTPKTRAASTGGGVPSAVPSEGWTGEHGGLWFPSSLTPRQRTVVKTAAAKLGLRHDSVAGEAGARHVVVWERSPTAPSSPPEGTPPAASTVSAVVPSNRSGTRRASSIPVQPAAAAARPAETDATPKGRNSVTSGNDSGAPSIPIARHPPGRRLSRRGRLAMAELEAQPPFSVQPGASAAAEHKGEGAPASSLSNGRATTTACKGVNPTTSGAGSRDGAAVVAPPRPARRVSFCVEEFGGDPVYAWGEGPAATAASPVAAQSAPFDARKDAEEPSDGQEWSVWSRSSQPPSPSEPGSEGWTRGGRKAGSDGAAGTAGAPPEASGAQSPLTADGVEGTGVETLRERRKKACFLVVGAVDGVAEELTDAPEDAETWETRRVVVEVKNRMNKAKDPPPLYDQIQLVTYMLMVGASVGDLVQFVKTGADRRSGKQGASTKRPLPAADDVLVSRVELDCRAYRHRKHWEETILPRLYAFARMVYRFRGDDLLRWRYLLATPEEQREMLVECCPYLDSVIPSTQAAVSQPAPAINSARRASPPSEVVDLRQDGVGETEMPHKSRNESGEASGSNANEAPSAQHTESNAHDGDVPESNGGVGVGGGGGGGSDGGVRPCGTVAPSTKDEDDGGRAERRRKDSGAADADKNPVEEISSSGGSTITVLSQRSRRGEEFLEPLGDAAAMLLVAIEAVTSPVRKKSKSGDGEAVDQPNNANAQGQNN